MNLPKIQLEREMLARLLVPVAILILWFIVIALFGPGGKKNEIRVVIKPGTSTGQIALQLQEAGVINSAFGFRIAARMEGVSGKLQAGSYLLSGKSSPWQIARRLAQGSTDDLTITIPEGFNLKQIAALVEETGIGSKKRFLELVTKPSEKLRALIPDLPKGANLEGLLFPDTYKLGPADNEEVLIELMLKRFSKIKEKIPENEDLDFYELVILGSIIEKEAKLPKERPLVSAVFHNRLKQGMRLQSCATVAYVLEKNQAKLSYEDLKVDSLFNTYLRSGLPPAPICNPGLASLSAAARPAKVDYLYFFAVGDGSHHFSRSYQEHLNLQKP